MVGTGARDDDNEILSWLGAVSSCTTIYADNVRRGDGLVLAVGVRMANAGAVFCGSARIK